MTSHENMTKGMSFARQKVYQVQRTLHSAGSWKLQRNIQRGVVYNEGKSPLLAKFLPVILTSHWASLSCRPLSSSALAHCLRRPACPCPSPTKTSHSSKHWTLALITAEDSRRRRRPVTMPSSLSDSGLPLLKPRLRIHFKMPTWSNQISNVKIWSC